MSADPQVFISYSSSDKTTADAICAALENASIRCWIAPRDITPGIKYAEGIVDGIDRCRVFLLVLSAASCASAQVEMEVERAASHDKKILSFRLEGAVLSKSLQYYLNSRHWLDASVPPLESHIQSLIPAVRQLLGLAGEPPGPALDSKTRTIPSPDKKIEKKKTQALPATVPSNPFTFGNPILDPARFFGRKGEIRQIVNRLLSSAHESTSIIGERRIGKTSLLSYLANPEVAASLGLTPDRFCLVYVDFQGLTDITPQRFWQRVLKKMARSVCDRELVPAIEKLAGQDSFDLFDLEDLFQDSQDKGLTTVLLMDEFEYVTENPNFKSDFFGGLRALAIHSGLALVPATRRELVDLCHSDEIKGSPFFNIFANVVMRPFTREDVDQLLVSYTQDSLAQTDKDFIWDLAGGYPIFVQMAGYYLLEARAEGLNGEELARQTTTNFNQQADSHYTYLWSHCTDSEKITLLILITLGLRTATRKTAPDRENLSHLRPRAPQDLAGLVKRGLVEERGGLFALFSESLKRWIQQEISASADEQETPQAAEEWLKSEGRDGPAEIKGFLPKFKKKYWPVLGEVAKELSFEHATTSALELISLVH